MSVYHQVFHSDLNMLNFIMRPLVYSSLAGAAYASMIIGSDNGSVPVRRQAITWTNIGLLSMGPLGTNFNEIGTKIPNFSFMKTHLNMSSAKCRPFCSGEMS